VPGKVFHLHLSPAPITYNEKGFWPPEAKVVVDFFLQKIVEKIYI
jgi:hypothetical protein